MSSVTVFPGKADGVIAAPSNPSEGWLASFLAVGIISGFVGITGILDDVTQTRQDIAAFLKYNRLAVEIRNGAVFAKKSRITNFDVDAAAYPDASPALAAMFCAGHGSCVISGAVGADYGQGNKAQKLANALASIGADIHVRGRDLVLSGRRMFGGRASASGDAPITMALSAAALGCETPVTIDDAYTGDDPEFFGRLAALGILIQ
jgi:5-enolpyruvylshikimate-3-phosphate synthase